MPKSRDGAAHYRFERLPEAERVRSKGARKPHEWLRMDMVWTGLGGGLMGLIRSFIYLT